jgi:hypothetical protein
MKRVAIYHRCPRGGCVVLSFNLSFHYMECEIRNSTSARFKSHFGGSGIRPLRMRDRKWRTWCRRTGSDVGHGSTFCTCPNFPAFFLSIVVVQNVPLRMTGSSMTTGCDVTGSEGSFRPFFGCFRIFSRFLAIDYVV